MIGPEVGAGGWTEKKERKGRQEEGGVVRSTSESEKKKKREWRGDGRERGEKLGLLNLILKNFLPKRNLSNIK